MPGETRIGVEMHEMSLVEGVLQAIEDSAGANDFSRVKRNKGDATLIWERG